MSAPPLLEDSLEGRYVKRMADELFVDRSIAEYLLKNLKQFRAEVRDEYYAETIAALDTMGERYGVDVRG